MAVVSNTCNGSYGDDCKIYLEYVINSQDIANNKSNITLHLYAQATSTNVGAYNFNGNSKAYIKIDGTTKKSSTTLNMDFRNKKKVEMLTWTGDVSHNTDGKLTITISGNFDTNGPSSVTTGSVSKSWTLTTIPRASSVTCADGNIGSSTTINISRASSSFTHTITYSFEGLTGTIVTKTSDTSIGWTIPTSFYAKIPSAKSSSGTITCHTYSGNTLIGTKTCTFNAMVLESTNKPEVTATVVDINEKTVALTGDANKLIKYFSNVQIEITATAKNSATIKSQKVVCGAKIGTSASNIINAVESETFNLSCTDSRGFTDTEIITKEFVDYIKLAFTDVKLSRPSTTSNTINCSLKGNYFNTSFGQVNNTLSFKYRYIASGETWEENYIDLIPIIDGNTLTYEASLGNAYDFNNEYEFEFVIEDQLMTVVQPITVSRGIPIIDIGKEDVTVNKQIYMGENKVLSYDINTNSLVDEEGNTYIQNKLIELFNGVASAGDTINLKEDYTKYNMLHVVTGTATGEFQGALLGSTISTLNQIDTFKNWLSYSETTGFNVQIHVASFTVIDSKTLTLLNAAFQYTTKNNTVNLQTPTACKVRKIYGSM